MKSRVDETIDDKTITWNIVNLIIQNQIDYSNNSKQTTAIDE